MTINIKEDKEIDSKIHNFIQNLVEEYGYLVVKMNWEVEVEKMSPKVYRNHLKRNMPEECYYCGSTAIDIDDNMYRCMNCEKCIVNKEETISTITDLGEYSTSDLVDELKQREGVEHININMKDRVEVAKEVPVNPGDEIKYNQAFDEYRYTYDTIDYGPMIILKIID